MHEVAANPWVAFAYLVAGVCFILALRGLSSPASSQRGNRLGMIGMGSGGRPGPLAGPGALGLPDAGLRLRRTLSSGYAGMRA